MDRLELIETLKHFPNAYAALVDGLSETALRAIFRSMPPGPSL